MTTLEAPVQYDALTMAVLVDRTPTGGISYANLVSQVRRDGGVFVDELTIRWTLSRGREEGLIEKIGARGPSVRYKIRT